MILAVLKETAEHEKRVALSPEVVRQLINDHNEIWIEKGAGLASNFLDSNYQDAGASVAPSKDELLSKADVLLSVQAPSQDDLNKLKSGTVLISFIWALQNPDLVTFLKEHKISSLGMDAIPRISRAQNMDALSSMSSIAGYKASLIAANELDKYFPMMMTAAGTIPPSKALILGAGVAGLQAIATCRKLGAVVEAFDVRPAVKEQVESLGAKFIEVELSDEETETKGGYAKELTEDDKLKQRELIHQHAKKSDIIITTALIPGRPAPLLITKEMVADMKPGSVIVDLAAENGGNCELTKAGTTQVVNEVKIVGPINLPSQLANHASTLYAKNMLALLNLLLKDGKPNFDFEDEILLNTTITHNGEIISPLIKNN
ncbi:MAG: NAD(P)(+) transhydrogenase (Re/Si-specific) subunit alpha [Bacteroidetes bacterium]|nr:NAD(P)(+) transhydrogenase (Re/Si-specific) subunit alpha [Bacteroidota bacterium]MAC06422.1 NAD(P)(+) transhydrogenase (Re/Si-specific) subunit alpha [Balneola sp.]MAO78615.1 NAD(P)(+) transhydrogenase (Re/Si-specific) subunit alpha [Balneola sp.]MBF63156.1 NAD(P)(+) transhydrogenase (Re/Si-specific) subunit alpha [Balneola sp.]HAW78889.1 Re/Si-specific NAD(P)(+) transhydrogenase subunit alpha [Balneola sp.]